VRRRRRLVLVLIAAVLGAGVAAALLAGGDDGGEEEARTGPATTTEPAPPEERPRARRRDRDQREGERPAAAAPRDRGRAETGAPLDGAVAGAGGRSLLVGISDQKGDSYADPRLRRLGVRHSRLVLPWDAPLVAPADVGRWIDAARAAGTEPLIVFGHRSGERCPAAPCSAPSPARFERAVRALRRRWPDVRELSTWNEPNHASQPVAGRPELVARYYEAIRRACRGCRVLAADFVADASAARYVPRFLAALRGSRPRLWGIHNYPDTNRFTGAGTSAFLRLVRGEVWITETGGIVEFRTADGRAVFAPDERRAARATRWMFRIARSSPRIRRLYVYQWRKTGPEDRFDAGLVAPDGRSRRALGVVRREIARR
jgi:hypothetical protein